MKTEDMSDALVFFGATGDLAHKMIFPALQALVRKGRLGVPIIGVAKAGWNLEQLRARARDSLEKFGGGVDETAFAERTLHLRFNELHDPEPIPKATDYSSVIESDVPIIVQHTRLDSRQMHNALLTTIAYSEPEDT